MGRRKRLLKIRLISRLLKHFICRFADQKSQFSQVLMNIYEPRNSQWNAGFPMGSPSVVHVPELGVTSSVTLVSARSAETCSYSGIKSSWLRSCDDFLWLRNKLVGGCICFYSPFLSVLMIRESQVTSACRGKFIEGHCAPWLRTCCELIKNSEQGSVTFGL